MSSNKNHSSYLDETAQGLGIKQTFTGVKGGLCLRRSARNFSTTTGRPSLQSK